MTAQLPNTGPHTGPQPPYRPQHNPPYTGQHAAPQMYGPQHTAPPLYGPQHAPSYNPVRITWTDANGNYPVPPAPYVTSTPHVIRGDRNGMGTAGLVLGIVSLCFAVLPLVGIVAWVLWPLGTIFSGVGLGRSNRALATNRNTALAGLIVSMVAAAVCVAWVVFTAYASATGAAHQPH